MKLTKIGLDVIKIDENNYTIETNKKIHLLKIKFVYPTKEKIFSMLEMYKYTNRFIIDDNIKYYNDIFKLINKKYYIENTKGKQIVSFFKKNNKVALNTFNLEPYERNFLNNQNFLIDILRNLEVFITDKFYFEDNKNVFNNWSGNVIISDGTDW